MSSDMVLFLVISYQISSCLCLFASQTSPLTHSPIMGSSDVAVLNAFGSDKSSGIRWGGEGLGGGVG